MLSAVSDALSVVSGHDHKYFILAVQFKTNIEWSEDLISSTTQAAIDTK